jgi:hypothetical protein
MANRWSVPCQIGRWVGYFVPSKRGLYTARVGLSTIRPDTAGATRHGGIGELGGFELRQ